VTKLGHLTSFDTAAPIRE